MESVMRAGVPPSHANSGVTVRKPPWMAMEATRQGHEDTEAAGRSQPDAEQNAHDGFHIHLKISLV